MSKLVVHLAIDIRATGVCFDLLRGVRQAGSLLMKSTTVPFLTARPHITERGGRFSNAGKSSISNEFHMLRRSRTGNEKLRGESR